MVKNILLSMCFLFLSFSNCFASNDPYPHDTSRWKLICENNDSEKVFLDTHTYKFYINQYDSAHKNCHVANAWVWYAMGKNNFNASFMTLSNAIYDFSCRTIQLIRTIDYDENKKVIYDDVSRISPRQIIPESLGEKVFEQVEEYSKQRNS